MRFIEVLEGALGKSAEKIFLPLQDGDVPALHFQMDQNKTEASLTRSQPELPHKKNEIHRLGLSFSPQDLAFAVQKQLRNIEQSEISDQICQYKRPILGGH
jgi:hypothetical protein